MYLALTRTPVTATVRPIGSAGPFAPRAFEFLLDARGTPQAQCREAIRILKQIGYEHRGPLNFNQDTQP